MITIDSSKNLSENVKHAYNLSEKFNKISNSKIEIGSNDHLDLISRNTSFFSQLIEVLSKVNNLVEENFPSKKEEAEEIKMALHSLHSSLDLFVCKIKNHKLSNQSYFNSIEQLESENAQIIEYINDINDYVLSDDNMISDDFFVEE